MWGHMPVILAPGGLKNKDCHKFKISSSPAWMMGSPPAKERNPDSGSALEMGRQSLSHASLGVISTDTTEVFQCLGRWKMTT